MKRLLTTTATLALAGCSLYEPTPAFGELADGQYLVVSSAQSASVLTVHNRIAGEQVTASAVQWTFEDMPELAPGDVIEIVGDCGACMESYPEQCNAKTAKVIEFDAPVVALAAASDTVSAEFGLAPFIGATILTTTELAPVRDTGLPQPEIVQVNANALKAAELPEKSVPVVIHGTAQEVTDIAKVLSANGFPLLMTFTEAK